MRDVILHSASFAENWAHFYFYRDETFLEALRERGYTLRLSNEVVDGRGAAAVLYLDAHSAGRGAGLAWARWRANLAWRLRRKTIPPATTWDPATCRTAFAMHDRRHPAYFDAHGAPAILVAMEGVMHAPDSHNPSAHERFAGVLTWNPAFEPSKRLLHYRIPQPSRWKAGARLPFRDRKLLTSISADKRAAHPLELYSARREAIWELARSGPETFEFYGMGWSRLPPHVQRTYMGEASDKPEVFRRFRFALVYENGSVPGYITEKIFDAMRSGCVPVYLGAPDVAAHVPPECFVDRTAFRSDGELLRYLEGVSEVEYRRYEEAIGSYLAGPAFRAFLPAAFGHVVSEMVGVVAV